MGTVLKEKRNSWLARVIVVVLALTFIVGLGYTGGVSLGGVSSGVAVEVNGESVPLSYYRLFRRRIYASQTEGLDRVPVEVQDRIDRFSISFIIERKMFAQKARALGLRVSDREIAENIQNNPNFHVDGVFAGPEHYRRVVTHPRGMAMSVKTFEDTIRDGELFSKLIDLSEISSVLSEPELETLFFVTGEKISIDYISFENSDEAQKAFDALLSSEDIGLVAEKSGRKAVTSPFFTRFETPPCPGATGADLFALQPESPVAKRVFSSGDSHCVAVLAERKKPDPQDVRRKIQDTMENSGRINIPILDNWVRHLYAKADVDTNEEILK